MRLGTLVLNLIYEMLQERKLPFVSRQQMYGFLQDHSTPCPLSVCLAIIRPTRLDAIFNKCCTVGRHIGLGHTRSAKKKRRN